MLNEERFDLFLTDKTAFPRRFQASVDTLKLRRRRVNPTLLKLLFDFERKVHEHVLRVLRPRLDTSENVFERFGCHNENIAVLKRAAMPMFCSS